MENLTGKKITHSVTRFNNTANYTATQSQVYTIGKPTKNKWGKPAHYLVGENKNTIILTDVEILRKINLINTEIMENQTAFYRVNELRSEMACTRENLEAKTISRHIGDFETKEEAMEVYNQIGGMEVAAQLLFVDEANNIFDEILTDY